MANTVAKDLMSAAGINSAEELMKLWAIQDGEMTPDQDYRETVKGWKGKVKWCNDRFVELTEGIITNATKLGVLAKFVGASESDIAEMKAMSTFISGTKKAAKVKLSDDELDAIIQEAYEARVELVEKAKAMLAAKASKTSSKAKAKATIVELAEGNGIDDLLSKLDTM